MKNMVLFAILTIFYCATQAQYPRSIIKTVYTPTNVSIESLQRVEFTANDLAEVEAEAVSWIQDYSSSAVIIAPSTRTYNCHNYAWHSSDGGSICWIDQIDINGIANLAKYWTGTTPTYQQTTASMAAKVFYPDDDHSAKVITPTLYESKWGSWPKFRHAPTDCPYISTHLQYYYVPISGDSLICDDEDYSTLKIPGATYHWSGSGVSVSGDSSSAEANVNTSLSSGWIQALVSSPYSGTTITTEKKSLLIGPQLPGPISIKFDTLPDRFIARIRVVPSATSYKWSCDGEENNSATNSAVFPKESEDCGHVYHISVRAVNQCGASNISYAMASDPPCANYAIFPNPANSEINISQKQGNKKENKAIRLVRIMDKFGRQVMKTGFGNEVYNTTLNISNLLTGSYLVQINQGVDQESYTIIKQ